MPKRFVFSQFEWLNHTKEVVLGQKTFVRRMLDKISRRDEAAYDFFADISCRVEAENKHPYVRIIIDIYQILLYNG